MQSKTQQQFQLAFGEPQRQLRHDWYWSLWTFSYIAAVNVLVDCGNQFPVVWVFDPHDPVDGVLSEVIKDERQIDSMIQRIEDRVKYAGRPRPSGGS